MNKKTIVIVDKKTMAAIDKAEGKLESLTKEQEAFCDEIAQEYIDDLSAPRKPNKKAVAKWLKVVYELYDKPVPDRIEIVDSPVAACKLASELTGDKIANTDYCGTGDGGWIAFYDYFHRIGLITDEEAADILALRDFSRVAWDTVLLDECAIIVCRPTVLKVDSDGDLHCTTGPCLEWANGEKEFAYHGTWVPERIITDPRSYTKKEYLAITNTEERRALGEIAGWQWVCDLLNAKIVDEWTDKKTKLAYALLATETGQKMLRKQSPPLKNREQPIYIEPVHEDLKTAQAARKWQATSLTPEQCESDPDLQYGVEA